jgi:SnoaL-like protein
VTFSVSHPFGIAVEAGDDAAALATLSPDVVFHSPAVHRPYEGRDTVAALLQVVSQTFEGFRYTNEWRDGATTILFFEAHVGDRDLQGVDILEEGEDGLVARFTVMVRPLSGLQALSGAVAARL